MSCICKRQITSTMLWREILRNFDLISKNMYKCKLCGSEYYIRLEIEEENSND